MEQQRKESKLTKKDQEKKPKYINRLLAAAEKRKRENERRIERQVQKEREEEGESLQFILYNYSTNFCVYVSFKLF